MIEVRPAVDDGRGVGQEHPERHRDVRRRGVADREAQVPADVFRKRDFSLPAQGHHGAGRHELADGRGAEKDVRPGRQGTVPTDRAEGGRGNGFPVRQRQDPAPHPLTGQNGEAVRFDGTVQFTDCRGTRRIQAL